METKNIIIEIEKEIEKSEEIILKTSSTYYSLSYQDKKDIAIRVFLRYGITENMINWGELKWILI